MNCLVSTKRKEEDGSITVLITCLDCGNSVRIANSIKAPICLSCGTKLVKSEYLSAKRLKKKIEELKTETEQQLHATAQTVIAGFSPAKPFISYRRKKRRLKMIAALPKKIRKMKKNE